MSSPNQLPQQPAAQALLQAHVDGVQTPQVQAPPAQVPPAQHNGTQAPQAHLPPVLNPQVQAPAHEAPAAQSFPACQRLSGVRGSVTGHWDQYGKEILQASTDYLPGNWGPDRQAIPSPQAAPSVPREAQASSEGNAAFPNTVPNVGSNQQFGSAVGGFAGNPASFQAPRAPQGYFLHPAPCQITGQVQGISIGSIGAGASVYFGSNQVLSPKPAPALHNGAFRPAAGCWVWHWY